MGATVSFGRPYASRICSIFTLCMESKSFVKSTNNIVACRFFARTPSIILRIVNICEVMDLCLRKPFWFFLRMLSILGSMRLRSRALYVLAAIDVNVIREGKLWTYAHANNTKAQIDFVFINKKWKNCAVNSEAYFSSVGMSSDHRIVTAKKYDWVYKRMPPEQRPPYTMNGPFLIARILEINM